jgi:WD40 repeat protein
VPRDTQQALELYRKAGVIPPIVRTVQVPALGSTPAYEMVVGADYPVTPGDLVALEALTEMYREGEGTAPNPIFVEKLSACIAAIKTRPAGPTGEAYFASLNFANPAPLPSADSRRLDNHASRIPVAGRVWGIAWSPDGKSLLVGYDDTGIALFDVASGRRRWTIRRRTDAWRRDALLFSADSTLAFASSVTTYAREDADKTISVLSAADGRLVRKLVFRLPPQFQERARDATLSGDGRKLLVVPGGLDGDVLTYDVATGELISRLPVPVQRVWPNRTPNISRIAIDERRNRLWLSHSARVMAYRLDNGTLEFEFLAFAQAAHALQLNPATGEVVAGGDGSFQESRTPINNPNPDFRVYQDDPHTLVRAFDPQTGKLLRTYIGGGGTVEGLSVSPDGRFVAATKSRRSRSSSYVLLWDAASGELLSARDFGTGEVGDVAFSPDGRFLAYGAQGAVHVVQTGP